MTIRKNKLCIALLAALVWGQHALAAERAKSFDEALQNAGEDGIIALCYGPDWNMQSVQMHEGFWRSAEFAHIAGDAQLVAVPFYQLPSEKEVAEAAQIKGSMPSPPFGVCPSILMFDKNGRQYAKLVGADYLGDAEGKLAQTNVADRLAKLRQQIQLVEQVKSAPEKDKAELLTQINELGITPPAGILAQIEAADKTEKKVYAQRAQHNALQFMYKQLDTSDGFLKPDFVEDLDLISKACLKIAKDEMIRPMDRQAAYNLYLGALRRAASSGAVIKNHTKRNMKISETSYYGSLMETLGKLWGKRVRLTSEQRKAKRAADKAKLKEQRERKKRQKKQGNQFDFN